MIARLLVFAVAGAFVLGGCGGSSNKSSSGGTSTPSPTKTAASGGASGKKVVIGADPSGALRFTKTTLAAKAGTVTLEFSNPSHVPHGLEIEGHGVEKETKTITGGKASLPVKLKPGRYEFYCPVDGHKAAGMKGTLTVR